MRDLATLGQFLDENRGKFKARIQRTRQKFVYVNFYPNEMVVRLFRNRDTLRDFKRDEYIRNRSTINFKRSRKS